MAPGLAGQPTLATSAQAECEITPVAQAFKTATFRPSRFSKRTAWLSQAGLGVLTGVNSLLGSAAVNLKQPNLSAKIVVKWLLGGAGAVLKQANLSGRIGVKSLLGGAGAMLKQPNHTKPASQDCG